MYEIETRQDIDASADRVWDIITSFREYDEWNPTITRMRATLSKGAPVSFVIAVGGREMKIAAEIVNVEAGRELRWRGPPSTLLGMFFRGEHYLRVEPMGVGKCQLVHGEHFGGASLPLLWKRLEPDLQSAYRRMNGALKARAEAAGKGKGTGARTA